MPISKIPGKGTQDLFNNISDAGTEGTKVAVGTTAQRGSTTGQWRFNSDTGFFEGRNSAGEFSTLEPTPTISSVDVAEVDSQAGGNQTIVVTGTNFASGGTITFVGNAGVNFDASTTTFNSATQVTAVAPKASFLNAQEPYKVRFTSAGGVAGTSGSGLINVDSAPTWTTSAGSLGSIIESATGNHFTVVASDADGDTISYSLQSGSLAGLSLNSTTGVISGDPDDVSGNTTNNFTIRATAGSKTADRAFSYITNNLNENVILYDGTNTNPAGNNPSGDNNSITSNVSLSNRGDGTAGTMREAFANATAMSAHSEIYSHYNQSNTITLSSTIWSILGDNSGHTNPYYHFGMHNGSSYGNSNIWFTLDFGGVPSFKIRRMTGYAVWGTGTADYTIWGTNDSSLLPGNSRGSFGGGSMTKIVEKNLTSSGNWDSGVVSNANYHRYLSFEIHNTSGGTYDWGWNTLKLYGDYY